MALDDIDREAMREGKAISKLRVLRGSRDRSRKGSNVKVDDERFQRAWDSIKVKK